MKRVFPFPSHLYSYISHSFAIYAGFAALSMELASVLQVIREIWPIYTKYVTYNTGITSFTSVKRTLPNSNVSHRKNCIFCRKNRIFCRKLSRANLKHVFCVPGVALTQKMYLFRCLFWRDLAYAGVLR